MEIVKFTNQFLVQDRNFRVQTKIPTRWKKGFLLLMGWVVTITGYGQSPLGTWVTIDDKRQVKIAHVEIYMEEGKLFGKVIGLLPEARTRTCEGCTGQDKGRSIVGMTLIHNVERDGDKYWSNGKFFDPKSGRTFNCTLWLDTDDELKIRISLGLSILGRTQTWYRLH